jgi:hypothetical protein
MGTDAALEGGEDVERLLASWRRSCPRPAWPGAPRHAPGRQAAGDRQRLTLARAGRDALGETAALRHLSGMPASKPPRVWSSADLDAAIERVMPEVLALLADGVPRTEAAIVAALADRHSKQDVMLTLMRLGVLGQLAMRGSRSLLATPASEPAELWTTRGQARSHRRVT